MDQFPDIGYKNLPSALDCPIEAYLGIIPVPGRMRIQFELAAPLVRIHFPLVAHIIGNGTQGGFSVVLQMDKPDRDFLIPGHIGLFQVGIRDEVSGGRIHARVSAPQMLFR